MSIASEIQRLQTAKADIKAAIENKGVTVGDGTIDTYAEKIGEIEGLPIDRALKTAQFGNPNAFGAANVTLNLDNLQNMVYLFSVSPQNKNTTIEHLTINCPNLVSAITMNLGETDILKHLTLNVDLKNATAFTNAFQSNIGLEIIDGTPIDLSSAKTLTNIFRYCHALREVRFKGVIPTKVSFESSSQLSNTSVQNIIDCLADLTGGTAQTLTLHANVGANLTDEQKAVITAKNWTLVY